MVPIGVIGPATRTAMTAYPSNTEHWWQGKGTESFIKGYQMIRTALYGDWGFLSSVSHP